MRELCPPKKVRPFDPDILPTNEAIIWHRDHLIETRELTEKTPNQDKVDRIASDLLAVWEQLWEQRLPTGLCVESGTRSKLSSKNGGILRAVGAVANSAISPATASPSLRSKTSLRTLTKPLECPGCPALAATKTSGPPKLSASTRTKGCTLPLPPSKCGAPRATNPRGA